MGNQLVGIAPSQIFPVEHYFVQQPSIEQHLRYEGSMGSTRFFKVAKAVTEEGVVVVKVFAKHDPTLPLEAHADRLETMKKTLTNAVNCLPFQRIMLTDKAALLIREYVKHSLYDRVSTRPFLTTLEKKWITFQILCSLNQCHKQKICHGDIKLENILITSWNWILLTDFASFKPTYLPEDNPADYTYFFDTSRRRTCYIAPERFVKSIATEGAQAKDVPMVAESLLPPTIRNGGITHCTTLLPEMDVFSMGCALLELWTEGAAPFEFSQLLAYRRGEQDLVTKHLQGIDNVNLRQLLESMLHMDPKKRKSAELYLDQERGRLFPEYFYSFLQSYLQMFSSSPIMSSDDKILRLHSDISYIIEALKTPPLEKPEKVAISNRDNHKSLPKYNGLILIITVVTSCVRGLHHCSTKILCLEILKKLSIYTTSETILDRILPYILFLVQDPAPRVQVLAMDTLTVCLGMVNEIPRSDANIFPEYILPAIVPLAKDSSIIVRTALAKNIAGLSETAVFFLEQTQLNCPTEIPVLRYEAELNALHEIMQKTVLSLLTDSQSIVKQTLMESGITKLCIFFGKQKANDVILSHMITFLNDKEHKHLRGSFFNSIVGVATYVGWQCSDILIPLLQQGLTDSEEYVIAKAIHATISLTELGLIQKPHLTEFIAECSCYLNHPNNWIRHEICGLISKTAEILSSVDVQCKIMPSIHSYLKTALIQVENVEIILDSLQPPVSRTIFDIVTSYPDIKQLIRAFEERKKARSATSGEKIIRNNEFVTGLKNVKIFRRLATEGLTDLVEEQLLSMKFYLIKLNKYKTQDWMKKNNGQIILNKKAVICHEDSLLDKNGTNEVIYRKFRPGDTDATLNSDWQHVFGPGEISSVQIPSTSNDLVGSPVVLAGVQTSDVGIQMRGTPSSSSLVEYSIPDRSFLQERSSECRSELENLRNKLKTRYTVLFSYPNFDPRQYFLPIPAGWRMTGTAVAHLHEHNASVSKLTCLKPYGSIFASSSIDGTVRLWDCNRLMGNQSVNRSRQVYSTNTPIYSLAACDAGQSLAVGGKDGTLLILRIDHNSTKMTLQHAYNMDKSSGIERGNDDGEVVDIQPLDENVVIYATLYGGITASDLRMQNAGWKLQNDLRNGVITTFCVDPTRSWLTTGTSGGKHVCWDLRFRLPIAEIRHPYDTWIRKVICHPTEPSWVISSSQGNNEVSIWNIETGHRQMALWASATAPLSNTNNTNPITSCGLMAGVTSGMPFLATGSSDQRIRYWDLSQSTNCRLLIPSNKDNLKDVSFSYGSRLIDGTRVFFETIQSTANINQSIGINNVNEEEQIPKSGPEMPSHFHNDCITDLLMCKTDNRQAFIISSSRDGVLKVWK